MGQPPARKLQWLTCTRTAVSSLCRIALSRPLDNSLSVHCPRLPLCVMPTPTFHVTPSSHPQCLQPFPNSRNCEFYSVAYVKLPLTGNVQYYCRISSLWYPRSLECHSNKFPMMGPPTSRHAQRSRHFQCIQKKEGTVMGGTQVSTPNFVPGEYSIKVPPWTPLPGLPNGIKIA